MHVFSIPEVGLPNGTELGLNIFIALANCPPKGLYATPKHMRGPRYLISLPLIAIIHCLPFLLSWYREKNRVDVLFFLITAEIGDLYIYLLFKNFFVALFTSHLCICFARFWIGLRDEGF